MGTITVKQLIELLNKSLEDGSIKNDSEVLYSHFTSQQSGCECYEFNVDFLWDTVEED
jgi:RNAse (barnase) inhibitor barstar